MGRLLLFLGVAALGCSSWREACRSAACRAISCPEGKLQLLLSARDLNHRQHPAHARLVVLPPLTPLFVALIFM
jgi:hypothetical protein